MDWLRTDQTGAAGALPRRYERGMTTEERRWTARYGSVVAAMYDAI